MQCMYNEEQRITQNCKINLYFKSKRKKVDWFTLLTSVDAQYHSNTNKPNISFEFLSYFNLLQNK